MGGQRSSQRYRDDSIYNALQPAFCYGILRLPAPGIRMIHDNVPGYYSGE